MPAHFENVCDIHAAQMRQRQPLRSIERLKVILGLTWSGLASTIEVACGLTVADDRARVGLPELPRSPSIYILDLTPKSGMRLS